jgi:hypothetical protein
MERARETGMIAKHIESWCHAEVSRPMGSLRQGMPELAYCSIMGTAAEVCDRVVVRRHVLPETQLP